MDCSGSIKQMQEKIFQTCGYIKKETSDKISTPLLRKAREAMHAIKDKRDYVYSLAKRHLSPLAEKIAATASTVTETALETLGLNAERRERIERKVGQSIKNSIKTVVSIAKKAMRKIRENGKAIHVEMALMRFDAHCDAHISRSNVEINKIDKKLNRARKAVLSEFKQINCDIQKYHRLPLDQTAILSLQSYLDDPTAEKFYQIGDAIRRQVDEKPVENYGFAAGNTFHKRLKEKGLDLQKVANLNTLLRKRKVTLQQKEEWLSRKKAARNAGKELQVTIKTYDNPKVLFAAERTFKESLRFERLTYWPRSMRQC